jgi:hypothetical protein
MFVFAVKLWDLPRNLANSNCSSSKGAEPCPYGAQSSAVVEGYRIPILVKRRSVLQGTNSRGTKKSKILYVLPLGGWDLEAEQALLQTQIRYLISTGKTQWENMERYIDGL